MPRIRWFSGDGTSSTTFPTVTVGKGVILPIYGRIPPYENAMAGVYSDTVVATVEW